MINFGKLRFKNFLSVGDNQYEIDLASHRSTLVVGHNGSGKSLMLDALSYVLFGRAHRDINVPQLVNSINCKACLCEVEFMVGTNAYKIVRGIKPNIFEIWENGELLNQESHSRDYQKLLETNILKLNHKSFHQVVVLGSGNFVPFMQLAAHHRRAVIEDLLDISIFSKMNSLMKDNLSKIKESIKDHDREITALKDKIELQKKHIEKIQSIDASNTLQLETEILDLNEHIEALEVECINLTHSCVDAATFVKEKNTLTKKVNKLNTYKSQIELNIQKSQDDKSFYTSNACCPTCAQTIEEYFRSRQIHECELKINEFSSGKNDICNSIEDATRRINTLEKTLREFNIINSKIESNTATIKSYKTRINSIIQRKTNNDLIDAESELIELDKLRQLRDTSISGRQTYLKEKEYLDIIADLLKDSGIKTKIILQYLPVMNNLINHYLQVLDFFVSFELDENFKETIRSRHRDQFSYSSFSEGEKARIDLALLFAWRQISKMKNSTNTNILILDEVFDSSMDAEGVENLLRIMGTLDEETRLIVITHKPESFEECFDRKITANKKGNFTTYDVDILK